MSNPFLKSTKSITNITVNNIIQDVFDNIPVYLNSMTDVEFTNVLNSQILSYDSTSSKWINVNALGGVSKLDDLLDVVILNSTNNQSLIYNTTSSKWENQTIDHVNFSNK